MRYYILLFLFLSPFFFFGQAPGIEWENTIGGGSTDNLTSIGLTNDGGYILGGYSGSTLYGDKSEDNIGLLDYWVIKIDSNGNLEWQNTIGGTLNDILIIIKQVTDGGYIVGGYSQSGISGDKTEANFGSDDYWILKLDSIGNIIWQKTIGGDSKDQLFGLKQAFNGSYLAYGVSESDISGNKTESNEGHQDYWIVNLDSNGAILWQKSFGGSEYDVLHDLIQTAENKFILGGYSDSDISGDKDENSIENALGINTADFWIIKTAEDDEILWQNTIGGDNSDYIYKIVRCINGNSILAGRSLSGPSADKTSENYGSSDYWILEIDTSGDAVWQESYGGDSDDHLTDIIRTYDNNYIVIGYSNSVISGNKSEPNYGDYDYWIIKIDSVGTILWQKTFHGAQIDKANVVVQTPDGGYIIGGQSNSEISIDKSEADIGNGDYWVIKLQSDECVPTIYYYDMDSDGFGNPAVSILSCYMPEGYVTNNSDCNDSNHEVYQPLIYFADLDSDTYGDQGNSILYCDIIPPIGFVSDSTDCDDNNSLVHTDINYFADTDDDLYGDPDNMISVCTLLPPIGFVSNNFDCDDSNPLVNPNSNEILNNVDDDCNGEVDENLSYISTNLFNDFQVYPNPNNGVFFIRDYTQSYISQIRILNSLGQNIPIRIDNDDNILTIQLISEFEGIAYLQILKNFESYSQILIIY